MSIISYRGIFVCFTLDVRSLAITSRSRQSNWRLSNMHKWEGVSVREEQSRCVADKVITIEQAYAVTTIQA